MQATPDGQHWRQRDRPGGLGLTVPVLRDADRKGLWQIATETADLASRAQERQVRPEEMGGASMTITNLGGLGGTAFTPVRIFVASSLLDQLRSAQNSPLSNLSNLSDGC